MNDDIAEKVLYDQKVKQKARLAEIIRLPKPVPFILDLVEHSDGYSLRVYKSDILRYNEKQREFIMEYLIETRNKIREIGLNCAIVGSEGKLPDA